MSHYRCEDCGGSLILNTCTCGEEKPPKRAAKPLTTQQLIDLIDSQRTVGRKAFRQISAKLKKLRDIENRKTNRK